MTAAQETPISDGRLRRVARSRAWAAGEALAVFAASQLFLWKFSQRYRRGWLLILGLMLASVLLRREPAEKLGLTWRHTRGAARWMALALLGGAVPLLAYGAREGRVALLLPDGLALAQFAGYFAWCALQQFALQSYLHNRLLEAIPRPHLTSALIGVMFASLHLPNPVLTIATLVGGVLMGELFTRHRNLWVIALGQALVSTAIFVSLPDAWHHRLRVGPGYDSWTLGR